MDNLETLIIEDIMRIFRLSRNGVYSRLRKARAGQGGLPLPIPTGEKQRLRWSAETVRQFLQNADEATQTPTTLKIESAKPRQKRHTEAMKALERMGVKVRPSQKGGSHD